MMGSGPGLSLHPLIGYRSGPGLSPLPLIGYLSALLATPPSAHLFLIELILETVWTTNHNRQKAFLEFKFQSFPMDDLMDAKWGKEIQLCVIYLFYCKQTQVHNNLTGFTAVRTHSQPLHKCAKTFLWDPELCFPVHSGPREQWVMPLTFSFSASLMLRISVQHIDVGKIPTVS